MPVDTWFPLAVYYEDLPGAVSQKKQLIDAALQLEQDGYERRAFPEMAWTGDLHGAEQIHRDPRFGWIVGQVEIHVKCYLTQLGLDLDQLELYIQRAWPVISRHQQEVRSHCHNTAHVSAFYYVSVPNSGSDEPGRPVFFDSLRPNEVSHGLGR